MDEECEHSWILAEEATAAEYTWNYKIAKSLDKPFIVLDLAYV